MSFVKKNVLHYSFVAFLVLIPGVRASVAQLELAPGPAKVTLSGTQFQLENQVLSAQWNGSADNESTQLTITDKLQHRTISLNSPFAILLNRGVAINLLNVKQTAPLHRSELHADASASKLAERSAGVSIELPWKTSDGLLSGTWALVLRDGSNYLRQIVTITAATQDAPIIRVKLIDFPLEEGTVVGSVDGSPIVSGNFFLGAEDPMSKNKVAGGQATSWVERDLPLQAGHSITYSSVIGIARKGQMRRDFLAYVERERAHPYRTFLHYNSWYDLGYFTPYDEAGALDRINTFGRELTEKRGVKLDSFLFDDGWDDHHSLWKFNKGFPEGFTNVRKAAERLNAGPGVWMSPWGGYSKPKQERIEFGEAAGYEIVNKGYALSGPKYYDAFRDVCFDMMRTYGVNQFKFDGTGNADSVFKGSRFDSDFDAAIHLIAEIRAVKPDVFINLTTGTWPSPFWLIHADSIWRGGEDDGFLGVGSYRERWITYRDADTYERVVQNGPLYPLNSLMLHGMIYAQHRKHLDDDPDNDFRNEVHSYFGTGTQLQEMYITPSLLTPQNWDDLAEAAKWSRANAGTLKDTHWVGGDPAWLQVYGWASWSPEKGILTLRNPSDQPRKITLVLGTVFELPTGAPQMFTLKSPWKADAALPVIHVSAQEAHTFQLAPFEVLTLEATARSH